MRLKAGRQSWAGTWVADEEGIVGRRPRHAGTRFGFFLSRRNPRKCAGRALKGTGGMWIVEFYFACRWEMGKRPRKEERKGE